MPKSNSKSTAPARTKPKRSQRFYRRAVAAIVQDEQGRILVCERSDAKSAWQFPQGGIDPGESREEALGRELLEEISLPATHFRVLEVKGPYRYVFPDGRTKNGYRGQQHHYFLVALLGSKRRIKVETAHQEFRATRWIRPAEFELSWLPPMKRRAYARVLRDFFNVTLRKRDVSD